jgi:hypothetical protein
MPILGRSGHGVRILRRIKEIDRSLENNIIETKWCLAKGNIILNVQEHRKRDEALCHRASRDRTKLRKTPRDQIF